MNSSTGTTAAVHGVNGLKAFQVGRIEVDGKELPPDGRSSALRAVRTDVGAVVQLFSLCRYRKVVENVIPESLGAAACRRTRRGRD